MNDLMSKIVALCKRRGFIFPGSEIYGGLGGTWDYGPAGSQLKKNFKDLWWRHFVEQREDVVGVDAAIMMNPLAWEASGHVEAFNDPLIECKICHKRIRADKEDEIKQHEGEHDGVEWTDPKRFNLLVEAKLGVVEEDKQTIYLRGEITNGVQVNFKNIIDSTRLKIPFGVAQMGKAFRNEVTPGNFTFRSREFEQAEIQYYVHPGDANKYFEYWRDEMMKFYLGLGIRKENLRFREHQEKERAHYAKAACDIEYNSPFGWSEVMGIHNRGDWDLARHQKFSGGDLRYQDPKTNEKYLPYDIESSLGVDRSILFLLLDAYSEEGDRVVLKLNPKVAPFKAAVFPLLANKPELIKVAMEIYSSLKTTYMLAWDDRGNIGKRYASQDEIGTPYTVTVDFDTLKDKTVTVRDRDTAKQKRVKIDQLNDYLQTQISQ